MDVRRIEPLEIYCRRKLYIDREQRDENTSRFIFFYVSDRLDSIELFSWLFRLTGG